jgi:predicted methyltransferase
MAEIFSFTPCRCLVLAPWESLEASRAEGGRVSVNIGLDEAEARRGDDSVTLECCGVSAKVPLEVLRRHSSRRSALAVSDDGYYEVELRLPSSYYKLVPLPGTAPTLEINGIHMHRVKDVKPIEDSALKVRLAGVKRGDRVLEVGTGLGYTAIESARRGARVTTVEASEAVLWVAERNPWSRGLADSNIAIVLGDACEALKEMTGAFDVVIHDPPRLTQGTGCLYSRDFYRELHRLLRPGGRIFHYTGEPGRTRGRSLGPRVVGELRAVGFVRLRYVDKAMGVVGVRP